MMAQIQAWSATLLVGVLPVFLVASPEAGAAPATGEPTVRRVDRPDNEPIPAKHLQVPQKSMVTIQPGPDATPQAVFVRLAMALEDMEDESMGHAGTELESLTELLAPSEIRCHLSLPDARGEVGDDSNLYSAEQVFYMLREYFDRVEVVPYAYETAGVVSPGGLLVAELPESAEDPHGSPHGILHLSVESSHARTPLHERLYVGLRRHGRGWRVEEIRQLP